MDNSNVPDTSQDQLMKRRKGLWSVVSVQTSVWGIIIHVSQMVWTLLERAEPKTTCALLPAGTKHSTPGAWGSLWNVLAPNASCCCRDTKAQIREKKMPEKGPHIKKDLNPCYFPFIPYFKFCKLNLLTCACHLENLQSLEIMFLSCLFT